ncbi:MAG: hypothetical protein H0T58_12010 [Gemmatimonadales bacterium]|nr:hypothetical protein [Gemmatimonadales bacterium]
MAPARDVRAAQRLVPSANAGNAILMALALLLLADRPAAAQEAAIRYTAGQLDCARFLELGESRILTESGGRTRRQTSARRGSWQFRAGQMGEQVALEGWLDTLTITRRSEETAISPDTDGLLGGRYRGTLSLTGHYAARVHPFVPDEVAEVAGMGHALDDFFPPLARRPLGQGESWSDSSGLTIRRLPDSASSDGLLHRFSLQQRGAAQAVPTPADSLPLKIQQKSDERGQFVWHPLRGLMRRDRTVVVETTVPPSRAVRQAVRSKVEQRITLVRDLRPTGCGPDSGGQ